MPYLFWIGFLLSGFMGCTLGILGTGGAILTVPILVYFFQINPLLATSYSMVIVGCTAAIGALAYWRRGLINYSNALIFIVPMLSALLLTRHYLLPKIPEICWQTTHWTLTKDTLILELFACLMLVAGYLMYRAPTRTKAIIAPWQWHHFIKIILGCIGIGCLSGLLGAGGGFMIIPILVLVFMLPIKEAVGTSLTIIACNSLFGALSDAFAGIELNLPFLSHLVLTTSLGMLLGIYLGKYINGEPLKKVFSIGLICLGCLLIIQPIVMDKKKSSHPKPSILKDHGYKP